MVDKVTQLMMDAKLFSANILYPRRYFDDLMVEQQNAEKNNVSDTHRSREMLAKLFGPSKSCVQSANKLNVQSTSNLDMSLQKFKFQRGSVQQLDTVAFIPGELTIDQESAISS